MLERPFQLLQLPELACLPQRRAAFGLWRKCQNLIQGATLCPPFLRIAWVATAFSCVESHRIKTEDVTKTKGNDFEDYFLSKELLLGSEFLVTLSGSHIDC